jgi:hypothetical protein
MRLNQNARFTLRNAGISQARWARLNFMSDSSWTGDACGCPDDRCIGHHHYGADDCGCLPALLESYRDGTGMFAELPS